MNRKLESLALVLNQMLSDEKHKLYITNIQGVDQAANEYYCLVLAKKQILLAERNNMAGGVLRLNLEDMVLYCNKQNVSKVFMEHFLDKVKQAFNDVDNQNANVYEPQQEFVEV
jgi:hypothetical protein